MGEVLTARASWGNPFTSAAVESARDPDGVWVPIQHSTDTTEIRNQSTPAIDMEEHLSTFPSELNRREGRTCQKDEQKVLGREYAE